jgi:hypothetical protein
MCRDGGSVSVSLSGRGTADRLLEEGDEPGQYRFALLGSSLVMLMTAGLTFFCGDDSISFYCEWRRVAH